MSLTSTFSATCADQSVGVITNDGKFLVGTLKGADDGTNIILDDSHERVFSEDQGVEKHQLGLCVIRGDNVAMIGLLDRNIDLNLNLSSCKAKPINQVIH